MGYLTTHVLDVAHGVPAAGVRGSLTAPDGSILEFVTNKDGRCDAPLLRDESFVPGVYSLTFRTAAYFTAKGAALTDPPFLDEITLRFGVSEASAHVHVPLLVSPWCFSTYRGS